MSVKETNFVSKAEIGQLLVQSGKSSTFRCAFKCPIDPEHIFDVSKLESHISDCRRRNAHLGQLSCPFNKYHFTKPDEHSHHLRICPDKECRQGEEKDTKLIAKIQMVELKLQCGLPVSEEDLEIYKNNSLKLAEK